MKKDTRKSALITSSINRVRPATSIRFIYAFFLLLRPDDYCIPIIIVWSSSKKVHYSFLGSVSRILLMSARNTHILVKYFCTYSVFFDILPFPSSY